MLPQRLDKLHPAFGRRLSLHRPGQFHRIFGNAQTWCQFRNHLRFRSMAIEVSRREFRCRRRWYLRYAGRLRFWRFHLRHTGSFRRLDGCGFGWLAFLLLEHRGDASGLVVGGGRASPSGRRRTSGVSGRRRRWCGNLTCRQAPQLLQQLWNADERHHRSELQNRHLEADADMRAAFEAFFQFQQYLKHLLQFIRTHLFPQYCKGLQLVVRVLLKELPVWPQSLDECAGFDRFQQVLEQGLGIVSAIVEFLKTPHSGRSVLRGQRLQQSHPGM